MRETMPEVRVNCFAHSVLRPVSSPVEALVEAQSADHVSMRLFGISGLRGLRE